MRIRPWMSSSSFPGGTPWPSKSFEAVSLALSRKAWAREASEEVEFDSSLLRKEKVSTKSLRWKLSSISSCRRMDDRGETEPHSSPRLQIDQSFIPVPFTLARSFPFETAFPFEFVTPLRNGRTISIFSLTVSSSIFASSSAGLNPSPSAAVQAFAIEGGCDPFVLASAAEDVDLDPLPFIDSRGGCLSLTMLLPALPPIDPMLSLDGPVMLSIGLGGGRGARTGAADAEWIDPT
jgi:hypothetical protein